MRFGFCLLLFVLFSIGGCAGTRSVPFNQRDVSALSSVYIDTAVSKPGKALFGNGSPGTLGMGPQASAMTTDNSKLAQLPFDALLVKNKIDIGTITYEQARMILAAKKSINVTGSRDLAKSIVKLRVDSYGIQKTHPFGSVYDPTIRITAGVYDRSGKLLWQESNFVSSLALENNKGQTLSTYYTNPSTLSTAFSHVSRIVLARIFSEMPNGSVAGK